MGMPAQAFAEISPNDLAVGQLFLFRGFWGLRVSIEAQFEGLLVLEGDRAGSAYQLTPGMAKVVAIAEPFKWYPMLPDGSKTEVVDDPMCTIALNAKGPLITGLDMRHEWDHNYLAISTSGHGVETNEVRNALQFAQWSAELCHQDQPFKSLGTLVEIDRRKKP